MRGNMDQKNSEYGHFLCSEMFKVGCRVQIWKKTFCQNSDDFCYRFIKNDIMSMHLLCIYRKAMINAPVPVTVDVNIKAPVNLKLQPRRHTDTLMIHLMYLMIHFLCRKWRKIIVSEKFFQSAKRKAEKY